MISKIEQFMNKKLNQYELKAKKKLLIKLKYQINNKRTK